MGQNEGQGGASVVQLVRDFVAGIPRGDDKVYEVPDEGTRQAMTACATLLMTGAPTAEVTPMAESRGYEAVDFHDEVMDRTLSVLRPKPGAVVDPPAHWGLYVFSSEATLNVVIQAPHPIFDRFSDRMAAQAFQGGDARALFVAGTHRHSGGEDPDPETADVARYVPSVFNAIHTSALQTLEPLAVIQFHGYGSTEPGDHTEPDTPATVNVILSAGLTKAELAAEPPVVCLVEAIKEDLRADTDVSDPSIRFLPNRKWVRGLMAGTNEQRQVMRELTPDVPFLHVETHGSLRVRVPDDVWDEHTTGRLGVELVAAVEKHAGA
ncbi:MAG: hypothetical protein ACR2HV_03005 [Acidimicrobiales bacterium]